MGNKTVFMVNIYNAQEGSVTAENFASLPEARIMQMDLKGIRNLLIELGGLYGRA